MRLAYFYLENYIGIYNGMGLDRIEIDFSKCIYPITVIKGDNGTGKSSLLNSINPFSDPTSCMIPGKTAKKRIVYQMGPFKSLDISYNYPVDSNGNRKPTTCSVVLSDQMGTTELNPNHNVNDGKSIICRELDIDPSFLILAQLSSSDRGLADKKPADRKLFINKQIKDLDVYNGFYKKLSRRSSELRAMTNDLSMKISKIGDIRSIQQDIVARKNQLEKLEEQKMSISAESGKLKSKLDDFNEKYDNPAEKRNSLANKIYDIKNNIDSIYPNIQAAVIDINPDELNKTALTSLQKQKIASEERIKYYDELAVKLGNQSSELSKKLNDNKAKLSAIQGVQTYEDTRNKLEEIKYKKNEYYKLIKERLPKGVYLKDITGDEYIIITNSIESLQKDKEYLMSKDLILLEQVLEGDAALSDKKKLLVATKNDLMVKLNTLNSDINEIDKTINKQNLLKEQTKDVTNIPEDCPNKTTCPFIKYLVEKRKDVYSDKKYEELIETRNEKTKLYNQVSFDLNNVNEMIDCCDTLIKMEYTLNFASVVLSKFFDIHIDTDEMLKQIITKYSTNIVFTVDIYLLMDMGNLVRTYKTLEKDEKTFKDRLVELSDNVDNINNLKSDIEKLETELNKVTSDIYDNVKNKNEHTDKIKYLDTKILTIQSYLENINKYNKLKEEYDKVSKECKDLESSYQTVKEYETELESYKEQLVTIITKEIPSVQNQIDQNNCKLVLYNEYKTDYEKYSEEFERIETLKHCCSPTSGLQTVYMEMYMNSVIGISNELLSMFFGGEYILQPFVINDKEFRMPVLGSYILNDDISSMSTSQICMISMIISFALLHQSSSVYNIIKLDELEGGLDTNNRLSFFNVLSALMQRLCFDQCIMISHNAELNMGMMDIIVLKNTDPDLKLDGNVIFELSNK